MATHKLYVQPHYLSDHSEVFSVHLGQLEFNAVTERDAWQLRDKLAAAIAEHTIDETKAQAA
jgi:hypothetical protein